MRLLRLSPRLLLALALLAPSTACNLSPYNSDGPGDTGAPQVDPPAQDEWIEKQYAPVQEQAKKISVDEFLALYPPPAYVDTLSYDPLAAAGLDAIRPYAGLGAEPDKALSSNGFVAVSDSPTTPFASAFAPSASTPR